MNFNKNNYTRWYQKRLQILLILVSKYLDGSVTCGQEQPTFLTLVYKVYVVLSPPKECQLISTVPGQTLLPIKYKPKFYHSFSQLMWEICSLMAISILGAFSFRFFSWKLILDVLNQSKIEIYCKMSINLIGVCRTPMRSTSRFCSERQFCHFFTSWKRRHKNDVTYMETSVCRHQ